MISICIITPLLLALAAFFNALMDLSSEKKLYSKNVNFYKWLNKDLSWRYKYENQDPRYGERFLGSTTIFVFTTDGWHMFQFLFHTCWQLAIAIQLPYWFYYFIAIKILFSGVFQLIYSRFKKPI